MSSDRFNRSRIATVIVAAVTSNLRLAEAPGNVLLASGASGLDRDSVVNVSQLLSVDRAMLSDRIGKINAEHRRKLDDGLRLVLDL